MTNMVTILASVDWSLGWDMVSAIATALGTAAIFFAIRQLRFEAWVKVQEIFTHPHFIKARATIFARLDDDGSRLWSADEKKAAMLVCRKMDELCRLVPYLGLVPWLGRRLALAVWDDPIGKAWFLVEPFVRAEQKKWPTKWEAFEKLGGNAIDRLAHQGRDPRNKTKKNSETPSAA